MRRFTQHFTGRLGRFGRQRRRVRSVIDTTGLSYNLPLVPESTTARFTTGETATIAEAKAAQRIPEAHHNRRARRLLMQLSGKAAALRASIVSALTARSEAHAATARLANFDALLHEDGLWDRGIRQWSHKTRLAAITGFGCLEVVSFYGPVQRVFDLKETVPFEKVEAILIALGFSLGAVFIGKFSAHQLRNLHDAHEHTALRLFDARDPKDARKTWLFAGLPALVVTLAIVTAGAILRGQLDRKADAARYAILIMLALAPAGAAWVVEYRYSSELLDRRDGVARMQRRCERRAERKTKRSTKLEDAYSELQTAVEQLWALYQPDWTIQLELAGADIAGSRATQPGVFHPLSDSVLEGAHGWLDQATTRIDALAVIKRRELSVEMIRQAAVKQHEAEQQARRAAPMKSLKRGSRQRQGEPFDRGGVEPPKFRANGARPGATDDQDHEVSFS